MRLLRIAFAVVLWLCASPGFCQTISAENHAASAADPTFRIQPLRPVQDLEREARAAQPPHESGNFRKPHLVELVKLDPTIKLDIRYATSNNFLSTPMYWQAFADYPGGTDDERARREILRQAMEKEGFTSIRRSGGTLITKIGNSTRL
jgi:hypothetical protein